LVNAFRVKNKLELESAFKEHSILNTKLRSITIKSKKYVELLNIDGLSFTELDKMIKELIQQVEYSYDNYILLQAELKLLKQQIADNNNANYKTECILLTTENKRLQTENSMLIKKCTAMSKRPQTLFYTRETDCGTESSIPSVIPTLKRPARNADGKYNMNGRLYDNLFGSREAVWNETAYKTTGGLTKNDLILNRQGNIVSKQKSIQETEYQRFVKTGVNLPNEESDEIK
jgi:uncharacterized protein YeeX (DUF496 family)